MDGQLLVRKWMLSQLDTNKQPFAPETDAAMQSLWEGRDSACGERKLIVDAFAAFLEYLKEERSFSPHYLEKQESLQALRQKMTRRFEVLKEYVDKYVMNEPAVLQVLNQAGSVITNSHIVYASLRHGSAYIDKKMVWPDTVETFRLCRALAEHFANDNVQVVIAPATGGDIFSWAVAYHLTQITGRKVLGVYAEKSEETLFLANDYARIQLTEVRFQHGQGDMSVGSRGLVVLYKGHRIVNKDGSFAFHPGYEKLIFGKRGLVLDDILNTGTSARKMVETSRRAGVEVVGVGTLVNRGGVLPKDLADAPKLVALANITMEAWDAKDCQLCVRQVPINTEVGRGREFLATRK